MSQEFYIELNPSHLILEMAGEGADEEATVIVGSDNLLDNLAKDTKNFDRFFRKMLMYRSAEKA